MDVSSFNGKYHRASEAAPGVLLLELNRKPVNAINDEMWWELRGIVERISESREVMCIVLSSALEKSFSAGLDLTQQQLVEEHPDIARKGLNLYKHARDFQAAFTSLAKCNQPVIAAIYGIAMGLAIDLASACDIRLAATDTVFAIAEVNVGLAADIGTLQRLPKIVGNDSKARELALTGRRFEAVEAQQIGFISHVIPGSRKEVIGEFGRGTALIIDTAVNMAKVIALKSPVAVVGTKHIMNHARDHSVDEGLNYVATWNMAMLQTQDLAAGMKGILAKKPVTFPPLAPPRGGKAKL